MGTVWALFIGALRTAIRGAPFGKSSALFKIACRYKMGWAPAEFDEALFARLRSGTRVRVTNKCGQWHAPRSIVCAGY
jgi:hypothetical protein